MTDRELLELAAKAAGFVNWTWRGESLFVETGHSRGNTGYHWNPLESDSDALRLAVKLELKVCVGMAQDMETGNMEVVGEELDPYAATRRAIVRAAAAIGKESK